MVMQRFHTAFLNRYGFQIAGAVIAVSGFILAIFRSTSSTASIGFLFVPFVAAFGAFVGDSVKYLGDLLRRKRAHSAGKTALILIVLGFGVAQFVQTRRYEHDLRIAETPSTPASELQTLLGKNDRRIARAVVANPSLPVAELEKIVAEKLRDYDFMGSAARNPGLSTADMEKIVSLKREDFESDAEYEVYQTSVWTPLAKRKDLPEALIHRLAAKPNPGSFLILALLESEYTTCKEKSRFIPQENRVLEGAIRRSMNAQKCPMIDGGSH